MKNGGIFYGFGPAGLRSAIADKYFWVQAETLADRRPAWRNRTGDPRLLGLV